jgi:TonB family protein
MGTLPPEMDKPMRKVIAAVLALSPMLLHAQVNKPAQTQPSATAQVLVSMLAMPEGFPSSDGAVATTPSQTRVSTGVTAPQLISKVDLAVAPDSLWRLIPVERTVVVSLVVDKTGKPENVKIVKSAGAAQLDKNVLDAVLQYRFKPGTLNNEPTAVPMNLEITVQQPGK